MKNKIHKTNNGITLIALVITIIVLLILAGVTIATLMRDNGILAKAITAKEENRYGIVKDEVEIWKSNNLIDERTEGKSAEERSQLLDRLEENGYLKSEEREEVEKTGKTSIANKEIMFWELSMADMVKIGDWIQYIPDDTDTTQILSELNMYSGSDENPKEINIDKNLLWRVFDKQGENIRIVQPDSGVDISLKKAYGYNNAVYLLDNLCKTLYTNGDLAEKVQNLKIEDIMGIMSEEGLKEIEEYTSLNIKYKELGTPYNDTKYPLIYAEEIYNGISGEQQKEGLGQSEQNKLYTNDDVISIDTLSVTQTSFRVRRNFYDEIYDEIFNSYSEYWLSSRAVDNYNNRPVFQVMYLGRVWIDGDQIYDPRISGILYPNILAPIVTLKDSVQIISGTGQEDSPYIIK